jgi:hypothetical protein
MNPIKSPYELLMEQAGFAPASPGMINTGQQMLLDQTGIIPHFADGGSVLDNLFAQYDPTMQQFSEGGQPVPQQDHIQGILSRLSEVLSLQNQS